MGLVTAAILALNLTRLKMPDRKTASCFSTDHEVTQFYVIDTRQQQGSPKTALTDILEPSNIFERGLPFGNLPKKQINTEIKDGKDG